jgi:hypothetical protein
MALGAELRLGQVIRCRRPDLEPRARDAHRAREGAQEGRRRAPHRRADARRAHALTEGYLRELERASRTIRSSPPGSSRAAGAGSRAPPSRATRRRRALNRSTLDDWFHEAERLAEVPRSLPGRAAYGVRRAAVDAAKAAGISREGPAGARRMERHPDARSDLRRPQRPRTRATKRVTRAPNSEERTNDRAGRRREDTITGFTGVVVADTKWLRCRRLSLQGRSADGGRDVR